MHVSVESVLAQTYRTIELVVVDDGSTDATPAALAALEPKARAASVTPLFLRKENGGAAAARNYGVRLAHGEYIALLDDDDTWRPEKLTLQIAELQRTGAEVCTCLIEKVRPDGTSRLYPRGPERLHTGIDPAAYLRGGKSAHTISLVMRREFYLRIGGFDERLRTHEDHEFLRRAAHYGAFCAVPKVLGAYNLTEDSLTRVKGSWARQLRQDEMTRLSLIVLKEHCGKLPGWEDAIFCTRAGIELAKPLRNLLWHRQFDAAHEWIEESLLMLGNTRQVRAMRRLFWKHRIVSLFRRKDPRDKWTD